MARAAACPTTRLKSGGLASKASLAAKRSCALEGKSRSSSNTIRSACSVPALI